MAYNTAAKAYGNNRIETATPAELTLMLYEGAVKFCNIAIVGLEKNDYEKVNTNIQKCRNIIVELTSTLNMKYPVAEDFKRMYDYIFALLTEANHEERHGASGESVRRASWHAGCVEGSYDESQRTAAITELGGKIWIRPELM